MKKMNKKSPAGAKVMSILLIVAMLFSLTACGGGNSGNNGNSGTSSQHGAGVSTGNNQQMDPVDDVDEPHHEIDGGANIGTDEQQPTDVPAISGKYTYELYDELEVVMDVDINEYITINDNGDKIFKLYRLASAFGWEAMDTYEGQEHMATRYMLRNGDLLTELIIDEYSSEISGTGLYQLKTIALRYYAGEKGVRFYTNDSNPLHWDGICELDQHYFDCEYELSGTRWRVSYYDIIVLSYILWSSSVNPGENPMVSMFGTDNYVYSMTSPAAEYNLP